MNTECQCPSENISSKQMIENIRGGEGSLLRWRCKGKVSVRFSRERFPVKLMITHYYIQGYK